MTLDLTPFIVAQARAACQELKQAQTDLLVFYLSQDSSPQLVKDVLRDIDRALGRLTAIVEHYDEAQPPPEEV